MKITTIVVAAFSLALLAACDRSDQRPAGSGSSAAPRNEAAQPTTPANVGTPSAAEKRESANPQQGQVDPKEPAQRKDFQTNK